MQETLSISTVRRLARLIVLTLLERFQTKSQIDLISWRITDPQPGTAIYHIPNLHANIQFPIFNNPSWLVHWPFTVMWWTTIDGKLLDVVYHAAAVCNRYFTFTYFQNRKYQEIIDDWWTMFINRNDLLWLSQTKYQMSMNKSFRVSFHHDLQAISMASVRYLQKLR